MTHRGIALFPSVKAVEFLFLLKNEAPKMVIPNKYIRNITKSIISMDQKDIINPRFLLMNICKSI